MSRKRHRCLLYPRVSVTEENGIGIGVNRPTDGELLLYAFPADEKPARLVGVWVIDAGTIKQVNSQTAQIADSLVERGWYVNRDWFIDDVAVRLNSKSDEASFREVRAE